jgi:hypothetical protein
MHCIVLHIVSYYALQVRFGRVGVAPTSLKEPADGPDKPLHDDRAPPPPRGQLRRRDVPGPVPDDGASVAGETGGGETGGDLRLRLVLGGAYGRVEVHDRPRVCREVHDGLATCLDVPPEWLHVAPVTCDDDGFVVGRPL